MVERGWIQGGKQGCASVGDEVRSKAASEAEGREARPKETGLGEGEGEGEGEGDGKGEKEGDSEASEAKGSCRGPRDAGGRKEER